MVSQIKATMYCCRPGCGVCGNQQCAVINVCTDLIFNTCCADEKAKDAIKFDNAEEYFEAVAAGEVNWED
ncbi:hypothetical protein VP1G_10472 [Cytospora mali]|nr:hypothetical protein VP1G_10472 [Valsa mali var. pyri (nom. inval.)]